MCLLYASTYLNDGVLVEVGDAELGAGGHVGVGTELEDAGLMRRWVGMVEYIRRAAVVEEGRSDEDRTARGRLRVPGRHVEAVSEEAEVSSLSLLVSVGDCTCGCGRGCRCTRPSCRPGSRGRPTSSRCSRRSSTRALRSPTSVEELSARR